MTMLLNDLNSKVCLNIYKNLFSASLEANRDCERTNFSAV